MTEEELKNKCKERAKIFQQAMESCKSSSPMDCIEWFADRIAGLEKENAELKEQGDKWFVFETEAGNWGIDKATQYTVDRHNYFYGTKNECQKWGVEHKIKDYTGHKYCYDRLDEQLTKAKELIEKLSNSLFLAKGIVRDLIDDTVDFNESKERAMYCYEQKHFDTYKEAVQFLEKVGE